MSKNKTKFNIVRMLMGICLFTLFITNINKSEIIHAEESRNTEETEETEETEKIEEILDIMEKVYGEKLLTQISTELPEFVDLFESAAYYHESGEWELANDFYINIVDLDPKSEDLYSVILDLSVASSNEILLSSFLKQKFTQLKIDNEIIENKPDVPSDENIQNTVVKISEELVESSLQEEAKAWNTAAKEEKQIFTVAEYTKKFKESVSVTEQWNIGQSLKIYHSGDPQVSELINSAARSNLSYAKRQHRQGRYEQAQGYYNRLLSEELVESSLQEEAKAWNTAAKEEKQIFTVAEYTKKFKESVSVTEQWNIGQSLKTYHSGDPQVSELINSAARSNLSYAKRQHRQGRYEQAQGYYNRLLSEELVESSLQEEAKTWNAAAQEKEIIFSVAEYTKKFKESVSVTEQWNIGQSLKTYHSGDPQVSELINSAARSNLSYAKRQHRQGRYEQAQGYYNRLLSEELVESSLQEEAKAWNTAAKEEKQIFTVAEYTKKFKESVSVTEQWNIGQSLKTYHSGDPQVSELINSAARLNLSYAKRQHRQGRYERAQGYYNRLLSEELVESSLQEEAKTWNAAAQEKEIIFSVAEYTKKFKESVSVTEQWNIGQSLKIYHSGDPQVSELINSAARSNLSYAKRQHCQGRYEQAQGYYKRIINERSVSIGYRKDAQLLLNRAELELGVDVLQSFHTTLYNDTFENVLDKQFNSVKKYHNVSKNDLADYLNPQKFLKVQANSNISSLQVATEALNVRTGPSIVYKIVDTINRNESYNVLQKSGDWYEIDLGGKSGWVSGKLVHLVGKEKELDLSVNQMGTVTTSALNVRTGPSTKYDIVTQITRGQKFPIVKKSNGWYQLDINGQKGWVSGNYVTIGNVDLLQFLSLSRPMGLSAEALNKELVGKGILENQGAAFARASQRHQINEIYLLAHAFHETGNGTSALATGQIVNGKKVYNMFGIGAYDGQALEAGSQYAYEQGWTTPAKAIEEGAAWIGKYYIHSKTHQQNTLYKMRWNPANPTVHQYATDIGWAIKQTPMIMKVYELSETYNLPLHFDIPIYK